MWKTVLLSSPYYADAPHLHLSFHMQVDPSLIASSTFGSVGHTSADAAYLARHVGLKVGLPYASTALSVNRLCGSGFQALVSAALELSAVGGGLALVGGAESMSQSPLAAYGHNVRFGHKLGTDLALTDTLWAALTDSHCATPMGMTAEKLATEVRYCTGSCANRVGALER